MSRPLAVVLIVAVLVVVLATIGIVAYQNRSCTVAIAGTDLQVTAQGPGSDTFCTGFIANNAPSGYRVEQPDDTGTLMCSYTINSTKYTVRDKGLVKLYGTNECQILANADPAESP